MKRKPVTYILIILLLLASIAGAQDKRFVSYTADPVKQDIQLYWKDDKGKILGSIEELKSWLKKQHKGLMFAMNGGMYQEDQSPLGLFIQHGKTIAHLNKRTGAGNFYLQPNGIFYITAQHKAAVCTTKDFTGKKDIQYATQSGPMLVISGKINPLFTPGSVNLNIRNGVGMRPDGKVIFVISKEAVNFYDFAAYFKSLGCINALYLDGFVSRMYLPAKNCFDTGGDFGVMIGIATGE
ncbi:phosphodiester glycosidase family protein [Chitinophagaceae bacterium MMS25-I14]